MDGFTEYLLRDHDIAELEQIAELLRARLPSQSSSGGAAR